ncbi:ABC transporter permease [Nitrospirillum sp. BR 11164]|uniref:ABC transporter permease n=1 Tax=Nitrospirillum sp. BR 11164 TaxID=3104324 RepID=UPI002AFDD49F|nr:ABC transporter permease [Nitrospirillum sp. BR 11164]MEA1649184.1 ABC transporter permease [Nitrospirillum sp. BR 11164]
MSFLLRRAGFYVVAFIVAATFNFLLPRLMPGNPVDIMFAQAGTVLPPESLEALKATFGFVDGPWPVQFGRYLASVFTFDLGLSVRFHPLTVNAVLMQALPWTLLLVLTSSLIAFLLGSALGVRAAWRRGGAFDSFGAPAALMIQAVPPLVTSLVALFVLSIRLKWLPTGYAWAPELDPGFTLAFIGSVLVHAGLPILTLVVAQIGGYLVTMRNSMINLLGEDYITLATAKGLSDGRVRYAYAARNALLPTVTSFAMTLGATFGGALITEIVFNYPGLGYTLYQGITARDYPLIQGQLMLMTLAMLTANFAADLLCLALDPRLRRA